MTAMIPILQKHLTVFTVHSPKCSTHQGSCWHAACVAGQWRLSGSFLSWISCHIVRDFKMRLPACSGSDINTHNFTSILGFLESLLTKQSAQKLSPRMAGTRSGRGQLLESIGAMKLGSVWDLLCYQWRTWRTRRNSCQLQCYKHNVKIIEMWTIWHTESQIRPARI